MADAQSSHLLRWPEVHRRTGICRSYAHELAAKGRFPRPVKIGPRGSAWVANEVDAWISERIAERDGDESKQETVG